MSAAREAAATGELSVGHTHAQAERSADAHARRAERSLGLGGRSAAEPASDTDTETRPAPGAVQGMLRGGGEALSQCEQRRYGAAFDHDFSHVRVHRGADAGVAAHSIGAQAFAVDHHIALPDSQPGLLTHELAHVVERDRGNDRPGVVRRISVGEWFSRLVGEGTYGEAELDDYLATLEETKAIAGGLEGDDKARAVVKAGRHKKLSPKKMTSLELRKLLIDEMLSGSTLDEDENAILSILNDASMAERQWLIQRVGRDRLKDSFNGEEYDKLMALLSGAYKEKDAGVPLNWHVGYTLRGDPRVTQGDQAVLLRSLAFRPEGATQQTEVASDEDLSLTPGQTQKLGEGPISHPRDTGGQGFALLQVGPLDEENVIVPPTDVRTPTDPMSYDKIDPLKSDVVAELDLTVGAQEVGSDTDKQEHRDSKLKGSKDSRAQTDTHEVYSEDSVETINEQTLKRQRQIDHDKRVAKKKERERSQQRQEGEFKEESSEHQDRQDEGSFKQETEGDETSGGTQTTDGSFDFSGKVDAELTGEIKKAEEGLIRKGLRWVLKVGPHVAPKQYRPILKKLGPIGEKILDLFKPGEDDLEIEFDLEGNVTVKGKFKAKTSLEGWRKYKSKSSGSSSSKGSTDVKGNKKGTSSVKGEGQAQREGVEVQEGVKQSDAIERGERKGVVEGKKTGQRDSTAVTNTHEKFEQTGQEDMKGKDKNRKVFIAVVEKATLSFKVM